MRSWLFRPLRPPSQSAGPIPRDLALEGLRGSCALAVLYAHLFSQSYSLDPAFAPSAKFYYFNFGSAAVLGFFVLSGYVIGLTTRGPATSEAVQHYARRRLGRLLPVTYAALAVTLLLQPVYDGRTIIGHLLFLQNQLPYPWLGEFPLLENNGNLWSLNYEALYYVAFLALWRWAPNLALVLGVAALLTFANALGWPVAPVFGPYACGAFFWLAGLGVAWLTEPGPTDARQSNWPSALACVYSIWSLGPLRSWLYDHQLDSLMWLTPASPHRLDFLPVCLWLLLAVTGRAPRLQGWLAAGCLTWATGGFIRTWLGHEMKPTDYLAGAALLAALITVRWKAPLTWLEKLAPVGAISFGLYVLGAPLQLGMRIFCPAFSGSVFTFVTRLLFVSGLMAVVAWLVERRFQPWVAARLRR